MLKNVLLVLQEKNVEGEAPQAENGEQVAAATEAEASQQQAEPEKPEEQQEP